MLLTLPYHRQPPKEAVLSVKTLRRKPPVFAYQLEWQEDGQRKAITFGADNGVCIDRSFWGEHPGEVIVERLCGNGIRAVMQEYTITSLRDSFYMPLIPTRQECKRPAHADHSAV